MFYMQMPVVFRKLLGGENVQILTIWYLLCILIIFTQLFLKIKHTIFLTCQRLWILSFLSVTQIVQERRIHRNFDFKFFKELFLYYFFRDLNPRSAKVEKRTNTRVQVYLRAFSVPNYEIKFKSISKSSCLCHQ